LKMGKTCSLRSRFKPRAGLAEIGVESRWAEARAVTIRDDIDAASPYKRGRAAPSSPLRVLELHAISRPQ
jgi:hypothetical protein